MKHKFYATLFLSLVLIFSLNLDAQVIFKEPLSTRIANYDISVSLNPETKKLSGKVILHWTNSSSDTLRILQFHTYLNAFKNSNSTFFKESGGQLRGDYFDESDKESWGWIDVQSIAYLKGVNLTKRTKYIQPDDGNVDDQTVMQVSLPDSILPGKSVDLEIKFEAKLPKIHARTGFNENFFFVGQWFPKIGVYEPAGMRKAPKGRWNCHQFHANTEFYADYGIYDVSITLPKDYIVGATGILQKKEMSGDKNQILKFRAEDVIDFAWTASKQYMVVNSKWEDVDIILLIQPEHLDQANRHLESTKAALNFFKEKMGAYPYPNLTIVDPTFRAAGSGGMEYPCLFTVGTVASLPESIKLPEMVAVHEFGHQYFMGILATNEFEEAWMDEGMNSYYESLIMDKTYGVKSSIINIMGFKIGDADMARLGYLGDNPKIGETYRNAWDFQNSNYGMLNYQKPTVWLITLERLLGKPVMEEIMKTYYALWKFKHPCTQDFIGIVNDITKKHLGTKYGNDMNWFFNEMLFSSNVCDYKITSIRIAPKEKSYGIYDGVDGSKLNYSISKKSDSTKIFVSKVMIRREGEVQMPLEILVHFENGEEITEKWDGMGRSHQLVYERKSKILWAKIDPENKLFIDINLSNNSYTTAPESAGIWEWILKIMFWAQNVMTTFAILA